MPKELTQRVISVIATTQKMPPEKISIDSTFEELGIDSLDGINILFALENEFNINIPDDAVQEVRGVRQMVENLERFLAGGAQSAGAQAQA